LTSDDHITLKIMIYRMFAKSLRLLVHGQTEMWA